MMTLFGITIGLTEIIAMLSILVSAVLGWSKLKSMLDSIITRNQEADKKMDEINEHFDGKIKDTRGQIENRFLLVEGRISSHEDRITRQEIANGRIDEKLLSIQAQLNRVLNYLEGKKND